MVTVSIRDVETRFSELAEKAEAGETIVITRDGHPVLDLVVHKRLDADKPGTARGGIRWEAVDEFKSKHGIDNFFDYIPDDFDDPLPEDILLQPLPRNE